MQIPENYQPASDLLKDRIILVTGASDGIGRTTAISYAAHGATVILLGKTVSKLEYVYDLIEEAGSPQAAIYPMHLEGASPHDYEELATTIATNFGRLDGILHNAALLPYLGRIKDYDPEDWMKVLQVNLNAPFMLTQACMPELEKSADASIIFVSDQPGIKGQAFWGAYGVSKFAIEGLSQTLAHELENSPLRVNTVDPGPTLTSLRKRVFPGEENTDLKIPEKLMPLYLWLMGPDSKGTTGQRLSY